MEIQTFPLSKIVFDKFIFSRKKCWFRNLSLTEENIFLIIVTGLALGKCTMEEVHYDYRLNAAENCNFEMKSNFREKVSHTALHKRTNIAYS